MTIIRLALASLVQLSTLAPKVFVSAVLNKTESVHRECLVLSASVCVPSVSVSSESPCSVSSGQIAGAIC